MAEVHGTADARLEPVREVLAEQLDSDNELGASIVVDVGGETLLDIWGGWRDETRTTPWAEDTIVNVWSTTKTVTSLAALMLVDRGQLDPYEKVATYWPEFGENGKDQIEVRHLMSHTSGVSGWDQPFTVEDMYDREKSTARLADAGAVVGGRHRVGLPRPEPGTPRRRAGPPDSGSTLTEFVAEEITQPLGADFQIGAVEKDWDRIAPVTPPPPLAIDLAALDQDSPMFKTFTGPVAVGRRREHAGLAGAPSSARSTATATPARSRGCSVRSRSAAPSTAYACSRPTRST